jgi:hypothetical protein
MGMGFGAVLIAQPQVLPVLILFQQDMIIMAQAMFPMLHVYGLEIRLLLYMQRLSMGMDHTTTGPDTISSEPQLE